MNKNKDSHCNPQSFVKRPTKILKSPTRVRIDPSKTCDSFNWSFYMISCSFSILVLGCSACSDILIYYLSPLIEMTCNMIAMFMVIMVKFLSVHDLNSTWLWTHSDFQIKILYISLKNIKILCIILNKNW